MGKKAFTWDVEAELRDKGRKLINTAVDKNLTSIVRQTSVISTSKVQ